AWSTHRHLEIYFAAPGMGAVLHTINIRLSPEHIIYIINHAEDKVIFVDEDILLLVDKIQDYIPNVHTFIVMTEKENLLPHSLQNVYSYEALLKEGDDTFPFMNDIDENDLAGMCYKSATTGKPKGVVYSHRDIALHSLALGLDDTAGDSVFDDVFTVVRRF